MHAEDQDSGAWIGFQQLTQQFQPANVGHCQIQYYDFRPLKFGGNPSR
jgi:hypothetical protein